MNSSGYVCFVICSFMHVSFRLCVFTFAECCLYHSIRCIDCYLLWFCDRVFAFCGICPHMMHDFLMSWDDFFFACDHLLGLNCYFYSAELYSVSLYPLGSPLLPSPSFRLWLASPSSPCLPSCCRRRLPSRLAPSRCFPSAFLALLGSALLG